MAAVITIKQKFVYVFALTMLLCVASNQALYGQGKLGRVRDAVRHKQSESKHQQSKPKRSESKPVSRIAKSKGQANDHRRAKRNQVARNQQQRSRNQRHQSNRHRSNRQRNNRNFGIGVSFNSCRPAPPRRFHVLQHPAPQVFQPLVVEQPIFVHEPVFIPQSYPNGSMVQQPIVEYPVLEQSGPVAIGADYFDQNDDFDWAARISVLAGTDFSDIFTGGFAALFQARRGIGLDTSVTFFRESGMQYRDHLFLGDVNLVFEPIANQNFRLRAGLGMNWLGDACGGDAGFNMTSGFDWRLSRRWMATGEVDFGNVGKTDLTHAQISLGRRISQQTDWTFGYNHHNIGGVSIGSVFTGLQFRF